MADLKKVYTAVTEDEALENLMAFKETWGKQYPSCVKSCKEIFSQFETVYCRRSQLEKSDATRLQN